MELQTVRHADGWWIEGVPAYTVAGETLTACGPYDTRHEAESDRRGMERFYRTYKPASRPVEVVATPAPGCLF